MQLRHPLVHTALAGATAGVLAMSLVVRLNPEVMPTAQTVVLGMPLWASWGAVMIGVPATVILAAIGRMRRGRIPFGRWPAPAFMGVAFTVAAVLARVNADLHPEYLSGSGHRILRHDAVVWLLAAIISVVGGVAIRRYGRPPLLRRGFVTLMILLPIVRLALVPSPQISPQEVPPLPLGDLEQRLLVIGIEGLDSRIVLTQIAEGRFTTLCNLRDTGATGFLRPFKPYLPRAHWTALGTGTLPRRNGVKSRWGWRLPLLFDDTLRLLPWTPQGSRLILPWGLAERVDPPPSTVPPLWQRLRASGVGTTVLDWPGLWDEHAAVVAVQPVVLDRLQYDSLINALEQAIAPFPKRRNLILDSLASDLERVRAAEIALERGDDSVWLHLSTLGVVRRWLEPLQTMDTTEREVLEMVIELLDRQIASLLEAAGPDTLTAVVSPYGLEPPDSLERLRRLVGIGSTWRMSAENCPDGLFVLHGSGIAEGRDLVGGELEDLAPTLCYLLGIPVAQSMDGRVILDVIDSAYLAAHPLRVID